MNQDFINSFRKPVEFPNWFIGLNPLSKLNLCFVIGFACWLIKDWRIGFAMCAFYFVFAFAIGVGKKFTPIFSALFVLAGVFTVIVRQFSAQGGEVMFTLFGWDFTVGALINGLNMSSALLGFSGPIILFFITTQTRDLMYALEQKGMSHTVSYIMLASFQTIIDLKASTVTIMESQKARGIETEGSIMTRIKAFFPILAPLILGALSSTEEKTIAMDARAFSVECDHTFLRELKPVPAWEKALVIVVDLAFVALCVFKIVMMFI